MIADRIQYLREKSNLTQSDLARLLGITRSSVNAWEMGISVPSTQYIVELSSIFKVSTDFLLNVENNNVLSIDGLNDDDIKIVFEMIRHLREKNNGC